MDTMALDLEEQEQLSALRAWWEKFGNGVTWVVLVVALAAAGYTGWRWYQQREAAAAAAVYDDFQAAVGAHQTARIRELAGSLIEHHGATVYAALAALTAARVNVEEKDPVSARAQLQWVVDKSGQPELAAVARVRLAGVLLDQKAYDDALKLLQGGDVPAAATAAFADRRGDVLVAQGKLAEARAAYAEALAKAGPQDPLRGLVQLKLDGLPG